MGRIVNLAGVESSSSTLLNDRAMVEVRLGGHPRSIEIGYGRLFFRRGRSWSASFRHIEVESTPRRPDSRSLTLEIPLRPCSGLVRDAGRIDGVILAPSAKIDLARRSDVWVMVLAPVSVAASIELSKRILMVSDRDISAQATLGSQDGSLSCTLSAYGSGFRNARLEAERTIKTGVSQHHGLETITVLEEVIKVDSGEVRQASWTPVEGPPEQVTVLARSMPSAGDITRILNALGCQAKNNFLLGPKLGKRYHVVGDGEPIQYRMRLKVDRPLKIDLADVAEMKISWQNIRG